MEEQKKSKNVCLVLIVMIIIALIGTLAVILFIKNKENKQLENNTIQNDVPEGNKLSKYVEEIIETYNLENMHEIIADNEELFTDYSLTIEDNENLKNLKKQFYNIFEIIADNKESLDKEHFLRNLASLKVEYNTEEAAGIYDYADNIIAVNDLDPSSKYYDIAVHVLYHELTHFLSFKFNENHGNYLYNGKFYDSIDNINSNDYIDMTNIEKHNINLIEEGGAEDVAAKYFYDGDTNVYYDRVLIYEMLRGILGEETMNRVHFGSYHSVELYKALVIDKNVPVDKYQKLVEYLIDEDNIANQRYVDLVDIIIEIYEIVNNKEWYLDKPFAYSVYCYLGDFLDNTDFYMKYKEEYEQVYKTSTEMEKNILTIENSKYTNKNMTILIYHKGKYYIALEVSYQDQNKTEISGTLIVQYDFDKQKILQYKL